MKKVSFGDGMSGLFIVTVMAFLFFRTFKVFALIGDVNVQFLSLSVIAFAGVILSRPRMRLMKWDVGLLAYIVMVILDGCLRTEHTVLAFEYWSVLVAFFAYKVVIQSDFVSMKRNVDWLYRCALIAVAAILLQVIAPAVVQMIQQVLMSPSAYSTALRSKERGYNTGLASQAAPAVWYCAPLLAFGIAKRFNAQTKKLTPLLLCGAAVIAMLFTQKRTVLLASLMAAYCLYFFFSRRKNLKIFRLMVFTFVLLCAAVVAYSLIPQVQYMVYKTLRPDNALSGREYFWDIMIPMFQSAPWFGVGGGTCNYLFGFGGHNCYLQLLAEYGIFGMLMFIMGFVAPFISAFIRAKEYLKENRFSEEANWLVASLFMQMVFLIYAAFGNPLFDYVFVGTEMISMGIAQTVLMKKSQLEVRE